MVFALSVAFIATKKDYIHTVGAGIVEDKRDEGKYYLRWQGRRSEFRNQSFWERAANR
jgi:hypothetical protein